VHITSMFVHMLPACSSMKAYMYADFIKHKGI
jgi:hypothetical protein